MRLASKDVDIAFLRFLLSQTKDDELRLTVRQMGELDQNIANYQIAGRSTASAAGSVTPLVVGAFRSAAVERELREHGDDIVKAIELQREFLQAVAADLQSELRAAQQEQQVKNVIEPYVSSSPLPADWKKLRANALIGGGDDQSVAENLSTFSAFVKQAREILEAADERSLVLLDELGAGTDPDEGAALAQAILEELVREPLAQVVGGKDEHQDDGDHAPAHRRQRR